ncbi:hypothetical protein BH23GEM5_BH23GEM5_20730 [soil metagenome]
MRKESSTPIIAAGLAGVLLGFGLVAFASGARAPVNVPALVGIDSATTLTAFPRLPRTSLALAVVSARGQLDAGRPWAAWNDLREHVATPADAAPAAVLLAARAAGEWGGWNHVRSLLRDQNWLDREGRGEGWWWLGQAEETAERWDRAAVAYGRYAGFAQGRERAIAQARLGRVLIANGQAAEAAAAYRAAGTTLPALADWFVALSAEAQVAAGSRSSVPALNAPAASPAARLRWVRAEIKRRRDAGDVAGALAQAAREARLLESGSAESAELSLDRAGWLVGAGRRGEARELLRELAANGAAPTDARLRAARRLVEIVEPRTVAEEMARAAAFEAARRPGLAARSLRAALPAGLPDDPALRLRIGLLLFQERDFGPARTALLDVAPRLPDAERTAQAELHAARSLYRDGNRGQRLAELRRVVERRPGTAAAGTALFLLGEEDPALRGAVALYARAAEVRHSPEAREALFRVGERSLRLKEPDRAAAIRAWESYLSRFPRGEQTAEVAYRTGLMHEHAGREAGARAMYTAAIQADPVSYHALRAGERLGVDPLGYTLRAPRPWIGLASEAAEARGVLARLDVLRDAGLAREWSAELAAAERRFAELPVALLGVAEGLAERGHTVEGIRIGRVLLAQRGGEWDARLLHVVFPLPMRAMLIAEADRAGVDPMLVAALVRQESSFRPDAQSRVGAMGLGQIMPGTGKMLARSAGVEEWDPRLLTVPEVNLRMGAIYLRDMLRRYDGAKDLALAGYNAGPGRADRWRRELGYADGPDAFRERIPFAETRHYVKVVLRNQAVYRRLYAPDRSPGLVTPE